MKSEQALQSKIIKYCREHKIYRLKITGGIPGIYTGCPDLLILINGRYLALEIKRPDGKGKVSPEQYQQGTWIWKSGGYAYVIDSWFDFIDLIEVFEIKQQIPFKKQLAQLDIKKLKNNKNLEIYS